MYDYTIIGGGPCGIFLSYILSQYGKKCLLIERENTLGGCNRVKRVGGYFTEHGPRIYTSNMTNFVNMLEEISRDDGMDISSFYNVYEPELIWDKEGIVSIGDVSKFLSSFLFFLIYPDYYKHKTVEEHIKEQNYSEEFSKYLDKICSLTDGGDSTRYRAYQLFNIINFPGRTLYQPKKPQDKLLFPYLQNKLEKQGVDIMLNTEIVSIDSYDGKVTKIFTDDKEILVNNLVLAIPPLAMKYIFEGSNIFVKNSFGDYDSFCKWVDHTKYEEYLNVTFHWVNKIDESNIKNANLTNIYTDWGLIYITTSKITELDESEPSQSIISCCIYKTDVKSKYTNKTAHNTDNIDDLCREIFRQFKTINPKVPDPYIMILSPNVKRENDKWVNKDYSFFHTPNSLTIPMISPYLSGMYNVGTHNLLSEYSFTSIESATEHSLILSDILIPNNRYKRSEYITIRKLVFAFLIIFVFIYLTRQ